MRSRRLTSMVEMAAAENLSSLRKPLTQFEDGSAAMACRGWDHDGFVWISNGHFMLRAGRIESLPRERKQSPPPTFETLLAAVPPTRFAPRLLRNEGVAVVGLARVNLTYLEACAASSGGVERLEWRASGPREPVYGLADGVVICAVMPMAPKETAS